MSVSVLRGFYRKHSVKMSGVSKDAPIGIQCLQSICGRFCPRLQINRLRWYQGLVLVLTYITYMTFHLTRKPISVVKSVLHRNCSELPTPVPPPDPHDDQWCNWAPFNTDDANALLGMLDSAFLFTYAVAMFVSGMVAERVDLRYFLSFGMLLSALFCYLFGLGYTLGIHSMVYYLLMQAGAGLAQTTGWPGTVTTVSRWFGGAKKGFIFGVWNSHTSLGNILGTLMAAKFVEQAWSLSFMYPALVMGTAAAMVWLLLPPEPRTLGLTLPDQQQERRDSHRSEDESHNEDTQVIVGDQAASWRPNRHSANASSSQPDEASETTSLLARRLSVHTSAISLTRALAIPGVVDFSLSLFFAKLVSYTFLYWLPMYISTSTPSVTDLRNYIAMSLSITVARQQLELEQTYVQQWSELLDTHLPPAQSSTLSTVFDVGGIAGAILAGLIADCTGCPAIVCAAFYLLCAPMLYVYEQWGASSYNTNVGLLLATGALVNGPYALITTSVAADLGTHSTLVGNSQAIATVTAIIDGTGSIGAAVGPMLAGVVSSMGSWTHVFYMLISCVFFALLLLARLMKAEVLKLRQDRRVTSPRVVRIE